MTVAIVLSSVVGLPDDSFGNIASTGALSWFIGVARPLDCPVVHLGPWAWFLDDHGFHGSVRAPRWTDQGRRLHSRCSLLEVVSSPLSRFIFGFQNVY